VISGGSVEMSLAPPVVAHSHLARSVRVSDYQTRLETRILISTPIWGQNFWSGPDSRSEFGLGLI